MNHQTDHQHASTPGAWCEASHNSHDIKVCKSMFTFKKSTKLYFCNLINLGNAFVFY